MNDAAELLAELMCRGIRVEARSASGTLYLKPKELLTPELIERVRAAKSALLVLLAREDASRGISDKPAPESAVDTLSPVNLELIADAIAMGPRSPFLNDLTLSHAARATVCACRIIRSLPEDARREALSLCTSVSRKAAEAIRARNYESAYWLLDTLSRQAQGAEAAMKVPCKQTMHYGCCRSHRSRLVATFGSIPGLHGAIELSWSRASWRFWRAIGGLRLVTYTLRTESGASLKGAGWRLIGEVRATEDGWRKSDHLSRKWQPMMGQLKLRSEVS